jgi:hypothetical protein
MKTTNIVLLALLGGAIYYFYKKNIKLNKGTTLVEITPLVEGYTLPGGRGGPGGGPGGGPNRGMNVMVPFNDLGLPTNVDARTGQAIEQTLDANGNPVNTAYQVRFAIKGIPNII